MEPARPERPVRRTFQLRPDTLARLTHEINRRHHESGGRIRKWEALDAIVRTGLNHTDTDIQENA